MENYCNLSSLLDSILPQLGSHKEYSCGDNNIMFLFDNCSYFLFEQCVQHIRNCGYAELQQNHIDNLYAISFSTKEYIIHLNFDMASEKLRIVFDDFSAVLNTDKNTIGKCPVRFWQFEIDHSLIDCGMCYIFQCTDYSFFIIDSAHTYSVNDDKRIYDFLRKNTPEDMTVTVSGWFFSHGHIDHIGKFIDILKYNNDINIKGIYYNFVPCDHFSSYAWMYSDIRHAEIFCDEVAKHQDIPKYKLHSGQYFYVDDLRVDVLCTHEDVYPYDLENYNDSSTVLMISVGDDKVCFPGDAGGAESDILENRFPEFLKSDIMQVAHHGHFGTSTRFYEIANSKVVLFATTQIKFDEELHHYKANEVACDIAEHIFIASNGTVEFVFPLKDSNIVIYPDEIIENFNGVYNLWGYQYSDEFKENLLKQHKENNCIKTIKY